MSQVLIGEHSQSQSEDAAIVLRKATNNINDEETDIFEDLTDFELRWD